MTGLPIALVIGALLTTVCLGFALRAGRRKRLVDTLPTSKTTGVFMQELTQTEDRIALARAYFNDIATFYNTRLETIPERYIAALGAMQSQPVMAADNFTRQAVVVDLGK